MKHLTVAAALAFAIVPALAYSADMKGMDMKPGDVKDMPMKDMGHKGIAKMHTAKGTVKNVDAKAGTVTLEHGPVKSLNWPAMTMAFKVQNKAMLDKFATGKKVEVEFEQRGKDYIIADMK